MDVRDQAPVGLSDVVQEGGKGALGDTFEGVEGVVNRNRFEVDLAT